jgi:type II secretory pathway component GspD/PulD (secretin)
MDENKEIMNRGDKERSSRFPGFYNLSISRRLEELEKWCPLSTEEKWLLRKETLTAEKADMLIENVIGVFGMPLGIAVNFRINEKDYIIPMVVEETSIVAAASKAAKLIRDNGRLSATSTDPLMEGQIQLVNVPHPEKAEALIEKLDIPRKQVYVEALIIETTLEKGSQFGVEWYAGGGNKNIAGAATFQTTGSLASLQGSVIDGETPNFAKLPGGFNLGILGDVITYEGIKFPTLGMLVNFLRTASGIDILSNPQILTLDNEPAEVFVGENRPYLVSTKFDANNNPVQSFDYRDVGVKLKITPHISSNNNVTLDVYTEVKKLSSAVATTTTAPITLTRQTKTKVKLKNNSTMVISGLIKNDSTSTAKAVPFFASIPLIGELFKSKEETSQKTNMMVFISVHIINNFKEGEALTSKKRKFSKEYKKKIEKIKQEEF